MTSPHCRDLIVLVADKNTKAAVGGLLSRHQSLGIRAVDAEVITHPQKDSGCYTSGVEILSVLRGQYANALLMFDREGCGQDQEEAVALEDALESRFACVGWGDRAKAIVFDPELEIWVWSGSPRVAACLGWNHPDKSMNEWLLDQGYLSPGNPKPARPKEAVEAVLFEYRTPRSSAIYQRLAETVSLKGCTDRAFAKFQSTLQRWFGCAEEQPRVR
jgi:hypothetical protein